MSEPFSWSKFFTGLFDPTAYFKTLAIVVRIALIALVIFGVALVAFKIKGMFFKVKPQAQFTVTGTAGGQIHNSNDEIKKKWGLINLW